MTTPAFLVELKAIGLRDLYHIQGFMNAADEATKRNALDG